MWWVWKGEVRSLACGHSIATMAGIFWKKETIEDTMFNITMTARQLEKMSSKEEKKAEQTKARMVAVRHTTSPLFHIPLFPSCRCRRPPASTSTDILLSSF